MIGDGDDDDNSHCNHDQDGCHVNKRIMEVIEAVARTVTVTMSVVVVATMRNT